MTEHEESFRIRAMKRFKEAFGEPEAVAARDGTLYRWRLGRARREPLRITLNAPELPDVAHIIVTDLDPGAVAPISSMVMRTMPEVEAIIERLRRARDD